MLDLRPDNSAGRIEIILCKPNDGEDQLPIAALANILGPQLKNGVTKAFPLRSPQRKEFHIGKRINSSTAAILGYAADVRNAYAKYKDELAKTGIIGKDVEALTASAEKLSSVDTKQEIAKKKGSPEATSAFQQAVTDVIAASDFIHTAAAAEFKKEAAIAKQFAQAKKLRFAPEPKKLKPPAPAPGKPEHPAPGN